MKSGCPICFHRIFRRFRELAPNAIPKVMSSVDTNRIRLPYQQVKAMTELKVWDLRYLELNLEASISSIWWWLYLSFRSGWSGRPPDFFFQIGSYTVEMQLTVPFNPYFFVPCTHVLMWLFLWELIQYGRRLSNVVIL